MFFCTFITSIHDDIFLHVITFNILCTSAIKHVVDKEHNNLIHGTLFCYESYKLLSSPRAVKLSWLRHTLGGEMLGRIVLEVKYLGYRFSKFFHCWKAC